MARLLIYAINYAPELTGSGKYTTELAEWFAVRGHQVDVITSVPHYPQWQVAPEYRALRFRRERLNGVTVLRSNLHLPVKGRRVGAKARILLETSFSLTSLRAWLPIWLGWRRYDAVLSVCPPLQTGVHPWLLRAWRGTPWVTHVQDLQVDAALELNILSQPALAALLRRVEGFLLSRADRVSTITEAMRRRLLDKGLPREQTWLLPNWASVDIDAAPAPHALNRFRQRLGLAPDDLLVLYAGNLGEKQGVEIIPELARLLRHESRLRFVVAGEGAMGSRLAQLQAEYALENLTLLPLQPAEELREMLSAADIHLVVQRRAASDLVMPSKLTNILAVGGVSLVTAEPGTTLHDVVTGAECGVAVEPEQAEALAAALLSLASDAGERARLSRNAAAYAREYLDKDHVLARFEGQLLGLIGIQQDRQRRLSQDWMSDRSA